MPAVLCMLVDYVRLWVLCFDSACFIKFYVCCILIVLLFSVVWCDMLRFVALDMFVLVLFVLFGCWYSLCFDFVATLGVIWWLEYLVLVELLLFVCFRVFLCWCCCCLLFFDFGWCWLVACLLLVCFGFVLVSAFVLLRFWFGLDVGFVVIACAVVSLFLLLFGLCNWMVCLWVRL